MRRSRVLIVACGAAFACFVGPLPVGQGQSTPAVFTLLGTDAANDDAGGWTNAAGSDTTDIDDVRSLAVATESDKLVFKVIIAELPADSELVHGQYCWMAGFQLNSVADELAALVCGNWVGGQFQGWVDKTTNRGTVVSSGGAFSTTEKAILINVPFTTLKGAPGDVLNDIYAVTFYDQPSGVGSLNTDDAAPDAKASAASPQSFGSYVVGGGRPLGPDGVPTSFVDLAQSPQVQIVFPDKSKHTERVIYNWTAIEDSYTGALSANITTGSVEIVMNDGTKQVYNHTYDATVDTALDLGTAAAGDWQITVTMRGLTGSIELIVTLYEPGPGGGNGTGGPTGGTAASDPTGSQPAKNDSPSLPALAVVAIVGLAAVLIRRRR